MGTDIIRMLSGARIKMRGGVICEFFSKSGIISDTEKGTHGAADSAFVFDVLLRLFGCFF